MPPTPGFLQDPVALHQLVEAPYELFGVLAVAAGNLQHLRALPSVGGEPTIYFRLRTKPIAHNPSTDGEDGTIPDDSAGADADAKNEPKGPTRRPSVTPHGSFCGLPAVPPLRYGSTRIRIEAQGRLRLGRLIVALGRVPPRRSKLSGAPDTFSALAGSGHRTGQSLQIVVGRYRGCSRRFHDFSRRSKRGVPSSPPEPFALPGLRSDGNTTAQRSHCKP